MTDIARLGFDIDTGPLASANTELSKLVTGALKRNVRSIPLLRSLPARSKLSIMASQTQRVELRTLLQL